MTAKHFGATLALSLALVSGCATITQGASQSLTVQTDPGGAICAVRKEAQEIAVVNPTPGTVQVGKGWEALTVACTKEGHQDAEARFDPEIEHWTLGNIIIGGLVGFVIDAASGAMQKYPPLVTIVLTPISFPSAAQRDRYFDDLRERVLRDAADAEAKVSTTCAPDSCVAQRRALDAASQGELAQIETRRAKAKVDYRSAAGALQPEPRPRVTLEDLPLPPLQPASAPPRR